MVEGVDRFTSYDLSVRTEAAYAVLLALVFTTMRWTANYLVLGTPFVNQKKSMLKRIERVFEEVWLSILSTGLLVLSWAVFLNNDVGASITNTLPCIHDWPNNSVTADVVYLLRIEAGYYLHQTTRGATASGVPIDTLMFYHHIATLLIIVFGYWKNLLLLGVLTVAIFNISNPFLHMSKVTLMRVDAECIFCQDNSHNEMDIGEASPVFVFCDSILCVKSDHASMCYNENWIR